MKLFPETAHDYFRIFGSILLLWIIGIGVAFIPGDWGKNLSTGIGLGNSLISLVAVVLVVGNYAREQELRIKAERREKDSVIQAHFFQLLRRLPDLLPDDGTRDLRGNSPVSSQVLQIYFREAGKLKLNPEQILSDLPKQLRGKVRHEGKFTREDLLRVLENLRSQASSELKPLLDQALRATLSDEQRRLLILQVVLDHNTRGLAFLGATGVITHVLNEKPDLVSFLMQTFPPEAAGIPCL